MATLSGNVWYVEIVADSHYDGGRVYYDSWVEARAAFVRATGKVVLCHGNGTVIDCKDV